jgi:hypothetical protein
MNECLDLQALHVSDRRRFPRIELNDPLQVVLTTQHRDQMECLVQNMSVQGMMLSLPEAEPTPEEMDIGDPCEIKVAQSAKRVWWSARRGTVAWLGGRYIGIQTHTNLAEDTDSLRHLMARYELI